LTTLLGPGSGPRKLTGEELNPEMHRVATGAGYKYVGSRGHTSTGQPGGIATYKNKRGEIEHDEAGNWSHMEATSPRGMTGTGEDQLREHLKSYSKKV
jgi:hypothetical protein